MAFDSNNNSPLTNGQTQPTPPLNDSNKPKGPTSPWEEDVPEEKPQVQQIGTLGSAAGSNNIPPQKEGIFVVPENIENQTALNVVEGSDFAKPIPEDSPVEEKVEEPVRNGAMDFNLSEAEPGIVQPVPSQPAQLDIASSGQEGETQKDNYDDLDIFGDIDSSSKNIAQDIKPAQTASPQPSTPILPVPAAVPQAVDNITAAPVAATASEIPAQPTISQTPPDLQGIIAPLPNTVVNTNISTPASEPPIIANPSSQTPPSQVADAAKPPKKSFLNNLLGKLRKNNPAPSKSAVPNQSRAVPLAAASDLIMQDPALETDARKRKFMIPLAVVGGVLAIFVFGIVLTESGVASFGFEKIYNAMGLEVIWGGLPKNAEKSLGFSLFSMKNKSGFKVTGDLKLTVNKDVESEITTPLVSLGNTPRTYLAVKPEKAILTVSDTTSDSTDGLGGLTTDWGASDTTTTDTTTDMSAVSDSSTATSSDSTSATSIDSSADTSSVTGDQTSTSATDQVLDSSYQSYQSSSKDVSATFDGFLSKDGNEVNLSIDKAGTSVVSLKNSADKLWVQSDKVKFNSNAEDGKWLEYTLSALQNKNLFETFFASDFSSISVQGQKSGNEKIDNVRCYHYVLDSIDLGESLSDLGISSDMIGSISGEVWIGVKDKLIRKINLAVTPASTSSVGAIELSLQINNYDAPGSFSEPNSGDIISDLAPFSSAASDLSGSSQTGTDSSATSDLSSTSTGTNTSTGTTAETSVATATVDTAAKNDETRKSDLQSLRNSLEAYYADNGKYPLSTTLTKLDTGSNILVSKLISNYISAIPKDPKDADGWFYGYKSIDGKSYYLTARLEVTTDPEIKTIDNIPLYFVYNE